jgi:DNA-binding NtrC family response regulator
MLKIRLFSEDRSLQPLLSSALGKEYLVRLATSSDQQALTSQTPAREDDVAILDLNSNRGSLTERVETFHQLLASEIPVILMADDSLRDTAFELVRAGAFGYCRKPPSIRELKSMLTLAHQNSTMHRQLQTIQQELDRSNSCDQLIGSSPSMQRVYELVHRVANLNASVLVTGESGTGKELIARAIHNLGSRADRPFVAVSCGAIPETLIEAELFGHEKGAFTGTVGAREGYFEQAGDGTLFLDEIGDLTLYTQVKLLRVLQQMEFSRLGSNRLIPLRARLVFATHQDLSKLVAAGKFRQDLYYRINVMRIESSALHEHPDDIPMIARHFVQHYGEIFQKPMQGIEPEAMNLLLNHSWPGNVRELENAIQRAIILAQGQFIRPEDLESCIQERNEDSAEIADLVEFGDYRPSGSFERQLRDYKIKLAISAVRDNNGNKTLAARSLSISRAYLHRLLRLAETNGVDETNFQEQVTA